MGGVMSRRVIRCLGLVIAVGIAIAGGQKHALSSQGDLLLNTDAYTAEELEAVTKDYQNQVFVLDGQIRAIQKEADWLVVKINRIADSGRKVPADLNASVAFKTRKIARLEKEKAGLEKMLARYKKTGKNVKVPKTHRVQRSKPVVNAATGKKVSVQTHVPASSGMSEDPKKSDIVKAVKKAGLGDWVDVLGTGSGCTKMNNTLPILFSSGSAALAKSYKPFLKRLSLFLKPYDVKVHVSGFADSEPIRTSKYPSNFELGASRAATIVHEMVKYGLKPDIFKISTSGQYHFTAKVPSKNKSFQRRAQITVIFNT